MKTIYVIKNITDNTYYGIYQGYEYWTALSIPLDISNILTFKSKEDALKELSDERVIEFVNDKLLEIKEIIILTNI